MKQSKQPSLPHQFDCKTKVDTKLHTTKHQTNTEFHNGSNNQQQQKATVHHYWYICIIAMTFD